jgi:hypothetical protein
MAIFTISLPSSKRKGNRKGTNVDVAIAVGRKLVEGVKGWDRSCNIR